MKTNMEIFGPIFFFFSYVFVRSGERIQSEYLFEMLGKRPVFLNILSVIVVAPSC